MNSEGDSVQYSNNLESAVRTYLRREKQKREIGAVAKKNR